MRIRGAMIALLLTAVTVLTVPAAAHAAGCGDSTKATASQSASRRPVIFVHGWTAVGSAMKGTGEALKRRTKDSIQPFYFDYGANSTTWAAADPVAGCLADYITAVSNAYAGKTGGDKKVILVGHSMGGLASLYAAAFDKVEDRIGALITFDTPYLGSPFGNTEMAKRLQGLHDFAGRKVIPPAGSDAQVCLGPHRDGAKLAGSCRAALPEYLPGSAKGVTAIAGEVTIKRTFGPIDLYDIPLGSDGVVSVDSQHGYRRIHERDKWPDAKNVVLKRDECTLTSDSMMRTIKLGRGGGAGTIAALVVMLAEMKVDGNVFDGLLSDTMTPGLAVTLGIAAQTADCGHVKVTSHDPALDHATTALKKYLGQLEPGTTVTNLTPVTAEGRVASGWTAVERGDGSGVDCSLNTGSPSAKKGDIYYCGPAAAMADACWMEAGGQAVLCLADPMSRNVVRIWMEGAIGAAAPTGPAEHAGRPAPIRIDLDNGARCRIRNGGSWGVQENDPDLVGFYSCDEGGVVWAARDSRTGIDQSAKTWTVRTGGETGRLTTRKVRAAYFVATA